MAFKIQKKAISLGRSAGRPSKYWSVGWTTGQARVAAGGRSVGPKAAPGKVGVASGIFTTTV